jgi:hypothetical protein
MTHRFRRLAFCIFAGAALVGFALCPALARDQPQAPASTLPSDHALDAILATRDWDGLAAALSQPPDAASMPRALNWLQAKVNDGAGFMIALSYTRDLWMAGNAMKVTDPLKDLRVTAGMMALYAYALLVVDGTKCEDSSAPGRRADQLFEYNPETFEFLRNQSAELKSKLVDIAIALEKKTAPLRKDDEVICRGGLAEIQAGLEHGAQVEVPGTSGRHGKTIDVTAPPGWKPKLVPPSTYIPLQETARASLRENLLKLVE